MKASELSTYLDKLLTVSKYRSILIDGPWGCGKTYEIHKYIKAHKKNCIYVSLFGLETIDEINTEIYKQSHRVRIKAANISNTISKVVSPVKYVNNIADALAFQLNEFDPSKIKKSRTVIIDDLERLSKQIEYKDLVGYLNRLLMNEVRIICLVSLDGLKIDSNRLKDFLDFREKVFDSCLTINQSPTEAFDNLFGKFCIKDVDLIYPLFKNNIRMAKKTELLFGDVMGLIDNASIRKKTLNEYEVLKACAYTVLCVIDFNDKPTMNSKEQYKKFFYERECEEYGENVTNGFEKYFSGEKEDNDNYLKPYVRTLVDYYRYMDSSSFLEAINIKEPKETYILKLSPFYLSDENKKKYFDELISKIKTAKEWEDSFVNCVRAIYADTDFELSDNSIKELAILAAQAKKRKGYAERSDIAFDFFPGSCSKGSKQSHFVDVYHEEYIKAVLKYITDEIENTVRSNNYERTIDLLKEIQHTNSPVVKDMFIVNSFFIPDLSEEITESEWSFCHKIADISGRFGLKKEYISAIKNVYCTSENKSRSLKSRLWALVYYGLDEKSFKESDLDNN